MRRFWRTVGLVALVTTQACWLQAGGGPQRQGYTGLETEVTAANVAGLTEVWTATGSRNPREALVDGARAYIRTSGEVRALDVRTGASVWTTAGSAVIGGDRVPAIVSDMLYVPDTAGACWLTPIDVETGAVLDRQLVSPEPATNSFCLAGDALTVGSTVAMRWSYIQVAAYPMCTPDGIISRSHWGVTVVDVDGGPGGWSLDGAEPVLICNVPQERFLNEASSREPGSVLITDGQILRQESCAGEGCPGGWDVRTGFPTGISGPPVVLHNSDVAAVSTQGDLAVIDGTTRAVEWRADLGSSVDNRPLASDPGSVFATTADGRLVAFPIDGCGAATCAPSWTASLPSPASARPSIGGDVLYVGSQDGSVSAFAADGCGAATCPALWTGTTPAAVTGAPVIAGGRVLVGSSNGVVTAFALPDAEG